ncbi:hypothetical protein [Pseudonocardia sp. GCM10023141]|uniref:hypothetical protein n=1 Tax=Pseudonocardia sp. GCM10023141 TaxID=3252653 RepID=UPI0036150015
MSRTSQRALVLLAGLLIGAGPLTTGCSVGVTGTPAADPAPAPTEGPGSDPVPWTGQVCTAVLAFATPATTRPDFGASPDLPAVRQLASTYLTSVVTGTEQGVAQLRTLGREPVPGGDAAAAGVRDALTAAGQTFTAARATVDGADPADPATFGAVLAQLEGTLGTLRAPDPIASFASVPRLQRAAEQAPPCQQLAALAANPH